MGGLVFYLIGIWIGSAYGPGALTRQLDAAGARGHLPLDFAHEVAPDLPLELHYWRDASMAAYLPASAHESERLALYAPFYLRGPDLVPVVDMPVDVSEYYFHALLEAHLRRQLGRAGGEVSQHIRARAPAVMTDVPPDRRVEAYVDALASFGAHLLAVANEFERKDAQRRSRGGVCPLLGRRLPLTELWDRMFAGEPYAGDYFSGGRVATSRSVLAPADKAFLVGSVLGSGWRGSVSNDLGPRYCDG